MQHYTDDIIFFTSVFVCISLGGYYKKIDDPEMKRNYGAGLGLLVVCLICGQHMYHSVLMVWGNVVIIKCCEKRYVHMISMAYTWCYLVYMHFNVTASRYVIWLHKILALRLTGLAFEVFITEKSKVGVADRVDNSQLPADNDRAKETTETAKEKSHKQDKVPSDTKIAPVQNPNSSQIPMFTEFDVLTAEPTAIDIMSYSFFFIGIHKGPYYRWKIFDDHFKAPFGVLGDCRIITMQKLKKAFICAFAYLLLRIIFPPELYYDDAFYTNYGSDSRYLYGLPHLVMYFLRSQMVMMLCTSVCTETGFGVYPAKCNPSPGHGPTTAFALLKLASTTTDVALEQEYNFSMLKCFENRRLLIGPKMRDTIRSFDMPTRYWFWAYTYKHMLRANKEVRSAFSFLAWAVWNGPSLQQFIIAATTWVYLNLEAEYIYLYDTKISSMNLAWAIGFGIMRILYLVYLTPCLVLGETHYVLKFYNSIFWVYHLLLLCLMVFSVLIYKARSTHRTSAML